MTPLNCSNIFVDSKAPSKGEHFETLLEKKNVKIMRILSSSKIDQEVMIQEEDEWFIMIGELKKELVKGDYCFLEAKKPHQVLHVEEGSIWLAVHIM